MAFLSWDSRVGVPKLRQLGLPRLWSRITLRADLGSRRGLKQSCNSRRELSNGMSHVVCSLVFRVDSRLLVVGSQNWQTPGSSTPGPSFAHNLCFKCSNEQCEPILDIYTLRAFQWYKERHKPSRFDPSNLSLTFRESTTTPSPKVGVALGVWCLTPSHSPSLTGVSDVTPRLPLGPHPCNPFCLGREPKARVTTQGGVSKLSRVGLLGFWTLTILGSDLRLERGLNQSCSYPWKLTNAPSLSICRRWEKVNSRLLAVESQLALLLPITWAANVQMTNARPF
jgi:hypothetical protein